MGHYTDTLGGSGHTLSADSVYSFNDVTGVSSQGGPAAPAGARFIAALVRSITGGTAPQLEIRNGRSDAAPLVQAVAATALAAIDRRGAGGDLCADGIWVRVTGNPTKYEVEILFK